LNKDVPATRKWGRGGGVSVGMNEAGRGGEKKKTEVIVEREVAGRREAQISIRHHTPDGMDPPLGRAKGTAVWIRRDEGEGQ
jgi:hypothetical protein